MGSLVASDLRRRERFAPLRVWEMTRAELVMATHDGALALGAQAHGLPIVGVTPS